uniref:Uncharacterized protein n=1 Tax=Oryza brachyantha TaxID=4533 RepID=J3LS13_ORYBR
MVLLLLLLLLSSVFASALRAGGGRVTRLSFFRPCLSCGEWPGRDSVSQELAVKKS